MGYNIIIKYPRESNILYLKMLRLIYIAATLCRSNYSSVHSFIHSQNGYLGTITMIQMLLQQIMLTVHLAAASDLRE